ncbi:hypothetical protein C8Q80DRAFT_1127174 [Daedaleopsis nitida]|nr:hypothetical protein C8Q80DRAFT_1127174 [Daedaleopsis nitida]
MDRGSWIVHMVRTVRSELTQPQASNIASPGGRAPSVGATLCKQLRHRARETDLGRGARVCPARSSLTYVRSKLRPRQTGGGWATRAPNDVRRLCSVCSCRQPARAFLRPFSVSHVRLTVHCRLQRRACGGTRPGVCETVSTSSLVVVPWANSDADAVKFGSRRGVGSVHDHCWDVNMCMCMSMRGRAQRWCRHALLCGLSWWWSGWWSGWWSVQVPAARSARACGLGLPSIWLSLYPTSVNVDVDVHKTVRNPGRRQYILMQETVSRHGSGARSEAVRTGRRHGGACVNYSVLPHVGR